MYHPNGEDSTNLGIKRNPRIKYVKADVFRKHEKIRDQEFEEKICELASINKIQQEPEPRHSFVDKSDSKFQRNLIENSNRIESLEDESEDEAPAKNEDFIIAQHYGSFDEEDNLDSAFSSMKGDSIHGDFDLQVVGSKIELPTQNEHRFGEASNQFNNVSLMGSKITFGEPSGDVFGLTFDNECKGIFSDAAAHEFQPINTLHSE